jgi:hypothetical protein
MTTQFTTQLPKIEERVTTKQRLTLLQGALLLQQYHDLQAANELLRRKAAKAQNDSEYHAYFADKRSTQWNELTGMLSRLFDIRVYSKESDGDTILWTAEYQGKLSKGHRSVTAAYEAAIKDILAEKAK